MNENDGTRSFETVQPEPQSKPQKPNKKTDLKKVITISIFAVLTAIILLFCGIIIAEVAYKFGADIKYTDTSVSSLEVKVGDLLIVNGSNRLNSAAISKAENEIQNVYSYNSSKHKDDPSLTIYYSYRDNGGIKLLPETIDALNKMTSDLYRDTGCDYLLLDYGHFTPKEDITPAIEFPHQLGTTADIKLSIDGESKELVKDPIVADWLAKNAHKYGFINCDPENIEHGYDKIPSTQFRYIGIPHATYIYNSETVNSLEQYITELKNNHTDTSKAIILDNYLVYYVTAAAGETVVKLPENYEYTISGDNVGGFIVTVDRSQSK